MKNQMVKVTDTNNRPAGMTMVKVEVCSDGTSSTVFHGGKAYSYTGKRGTSLVAPAGRTTFEMATIADERLWIDSGLTHIWMD